MGEEFKCIRVDEGLNIITIEFLGNENVDILDVLDEFCDATYEKWFDSYMHHIFRISNEVIKNLYQHGVGKGLFILIRQDDNYLFEIVDYNTDHFKYDDLLKLNKKNGWVRATSSNKNIGLGWIHDLVSEKGMTLSVDDTKGGLNYFGSYIV